MCKKIILLIAFLSNINIHSQIIKPVKWSSEIDKSSHNNYILIFNGVIDEGWHLYSQFTPEGGPLPMSLNFKNQKNNYELISTSKESAFKKQFNDVFGVEEYYFENKVTIQQKVRILNKNLNQIKVNLDYQICKNACINDNKNFVFDIPSTFKPSSKNILEKDSSLIVDSKNIKIITEKNTSKITKNEFKKEKKKGFLMIFFLAFLGGLAALFTPCVFPMIPMTVSFFTKQRKSKSHGKRNAFIYGISIILIYVILGLAITWIFGADALNAISTNVWFNIIFFLLLSFFAFSFLGAFEIMLPNSWANKVDKQADKGGVIGIIFMALALAIVSFSCTGPIVGTLLVESASKGGIAPIIGMLGFSTALAFPFMLFAMFPSWLKSLPKSGGWLNTVKVFLGFLELALAFKFLSNADLVMQTHYFEREIFLSIWIAIFGVLTMYLLGKINLPHDSPISNISVGRLTLALLTLTFTIYMIPGLIGAPLKFISAYIPPQNYSENQITINSKIEQSHLPPGADIGPHGIMVFNDYETGLMFAKTVNKPILLDFTGYACSNCRLMESNVWSNKNILNILKNEVVLISLHVDDKRYLPKEKQFISKITGEKIETVGDKWTDLMISKYKANTQPLYVLIDLNNNNLNPEMPTISYNPNALIYQNWIEVGISNFLNK